MWRTITLTGCLLRNSLRSFILKRLSDSSKEDFPISCSGSMPGCQDFVSLGRVRERVGPIISYENVYLIPLLYYDILAINYFQNLSVQRPSASPSPKVKTFTLIVSGDEGQSFHWLVSWAEAWLTLLESHLYPQLLDPLIPECLGVWRNNKFTSDFSLCQLGILLLWVYRDSCLVLPASRIVSLISSFIFIILVGLYSF